MYIKFEMCYCQYLLWLNFFAGMFRCNQHHNGCEECSDGRKSTVVAGRSCCYVTEGMNMMADTSYSMHLIPRFLFYCRKPRFIIVQNKKHADLDLNKFGIPV